VAKERAHLDEALAEKGLKWALAYRNWTKKMWRRKAIWGDELTIERVGRRRRKWIVRYPKEKWNRNCVEEAPRKEERKIGQIEEGYVQSCAGIEGRKVRCGCIRYGGCYLIVHSRSETSARS